MESLSDVSILQYIPNIYPIPIMIARTSTIHVRMVKVLFYSVVYPDKNNFERFAIYLTLTLFGNEWDIPGYPMPVCIELLLYWIPQMSLDV